MSIETFDTVTDADREARKYSPYFDIIWAISQRVLPDFYRQGCCEMGL